MKNLFLLFALIFFYSIDVSSQLSKWLVHETNGQLQLVDFTPSTPVVSVPATGYGVTGDEDVNLMTDSAGNILFSFFCNGSNLIEVRDRNWQIMPNGTGLIGHSSSLKSCVVRIPCTVDKYYIIHFRTGLGAGFLYYSILDMSANGGMGDITQKNILLGSDFDEGLAISHQMRNGCRWLFASKVSGNSQPVYRMLVSNTGIGSPVLAATINYTVPASFAQDLQISPDNSKIVLSTLQTNSLSPDIVTWDFDLNSGDLSNRSDFFVSSQPVIGVEFSPDNLNVYWRTNMSTDNSELGRVVLSTGVVDLIDNNFGRYGTAIEAASNGRLYMSHNYNHGFLSEISNPNSANIATIGYTFASVFIGTSGCRVGLPNAVDGEVPNTSVVPTSIDFSVVATSNCNEYIFMDSTCLGTWWEWDFGDGTGSNQQFPTHSYNTNGIYDVNLRVLVCDDTLSLTKTGLINTTTGLNINLNSSPSVRCFGSHDGAASVNPAGTPPFQYLWTLPGGSIMTTSSISHLPAGNYSVSVIDSNGCSAIQYFTITEPLPLNVSVSGINAGCSGMYGTATASVTGGTGAYTYGWNTVPLQDSSTAINLTPGNYSVTVSDSLNCTATAGVIIANISSVIFSITSTPEHCLAGDGTISVTHTGGVGPFSYHWIPVNDTTLSMITGLMAGTYTVIATDLSTGCAQTLSEQILNSSGINATITASSNATCENDEDGSATVSALGGQPPYSYIWSNGDTTATTNHLPAGTHNVMVFDYSGCNAFATITIGFNFSMPALELGPDTLPCAGTPYLMDAGSGNTSYLWSDNSTNQTLSVTTSGNYSVLVTNSNGCETFDAINVNFVTCYRQGIPHPHQFNSPVSVFPNPLINELNVSVNQIINTEIILSIMDVTGKNLYFSKDFSENYFHKKINVSNFAPGIYLVKIKFNNETVVKRFSKN